MGRAPLRLPWISVQWVVSQIDAERLVVCHLGGGFGDGGARRAVWETTMGFSPLEGVPMATRSGSVDPGALLYLLRERLLTEEELEQALEHESGLAGLSGGGSGDVREASPLALDVFVHRVAAAVAARAAACDGIDVLAFTGGIGEHSRDVRERIVQRVRFLGDFRVEVVPSREELVMAETRGLLEVELRAAQAEAKVSRGRTGGNRPAMSRLERRRWAAGTGIGHGQVRNPVLRHQAPGLADRAVHSNADERRHCGCPGGQLVEVERHGRHEVEIGHDRPELRRLAVLRDSKTKIAWTPYVAIIRATTRSGVSGGQLMTPRLIASPTVPTSNATGGSSGRCVTYTMPR